jgi:hypothetical protein
MANPNVFKLILLCSVMVISTWYWKSISTSLVVSASPLLQPRALAYRELNPSTSFAPTCQFQGNSDVYGLGVRLGVYLQWIASHIANRNRHCKESIGGFLDTNTIFLSALIIATGLLSLERSSTYAVEIAIVLYLIWGTLGSVLVINGYRTVLAPSER